ncbi:MAG: DNA-binding GntR family transcriptional regulator, partial [Saprospiraceae bacterium]
LSLENIVDSFGSSRKTQILKTIAYLVDEGLLVEENGKFDFVD